MNLHEPFKAKQNKTLELDKEIEFIYIFIEMLGVNGETVKLCVQTLFMLLSILIEVAELCKKPGGGDFDKKIMVDLDHLKEYPYCGSMLPWDATEEISGRAVNAEPSKKLYRWVVYLIGTRYSLVGKTYERFDCSGTVITDRYL